MPLMSEVAREAGVSAATASRVLNPASTHPVSAAARAKVLEAAARLDFRPNQLARGLRTRRAHTISLIVHDVRDPYFSECARGAADEAMEAGYLTLICNTDREPATELRYVQMLRESRVSGLLFIGGGLEHSRYRRDIATEIKAIGDYGGAAVALGPRRDRWPAEVPDNKGGARVATDHLISLGHRSIAFLDGPPALVTSRERLLGYQEALNVAGIELVPQLVECGRYSAEGGAEATTRLLDSDHELTAIFASNDAMAIGCLQQLRSRGLKVPQDISLVGFDDIPIVGWLDPPLTTVRVPMRKLGAAGVRRVLAAVESPSGRAQPKGPRVTVHATELVVRDSSAPPRKKRV